MVTLARKEIWFRGIFHLIGIPGESQFASKLRKAESTQHGGQWIGGILRYLQAFFWLRAFSALKHFPSPPQYPVKIARGRPQTVGPLLSENIHNLHSSKTHDSIAMDWQTD